MITYRPEALTPRATHYCYVCKRNCYCTPDSTGQVNKECSHRNHNREVPKMPKLKSGCYKLNVKEQNGSKSD